MSNPYQALDKKKAPVSVVTTFDSDDDKYIIEYDIKERVVMLSDKDDDFVIKKEVVEVSRTDRQEFLNSQADDVGIMNIIKKVALSGDQSLLNQTGRVANPVVGKTDDGRDLEAIVDVTNYQVDKIDAFESIKKGSSTFKDLDSDLKKNLNLEGVAKLSDEEIVAYVRSRAASQVKKDSSTEEKGDK